MLRPAAVHSLMLRYSAVHSVMLSPAAVHSLMLRHSAVHSVMLRHAAVHSVMLCHAAVHGIIRRVDYHSFEICQKLIIKKFPSKEAQEKKNELQVVLARTQRAC